jgi:hypothetical protein
MPTLLRREASVRPARTDRTFGSMLARASHAVKPRRRPGRQRDATGRTAQHRRPSAVGDDRRAEMEMEMEMEGLLR